MAKAWIVDLWTKDAHVELPDGTRQKLVPTAQQLKAVKTLPEQFRTTKYGRGKRWRVSWYEDKEGQRVQRAQLFETKKDAEALVAELEDDIRTGRYIDPSRKARSFREASETWLSSKHRIKDATWRRYRLELDQYVLPRWGTVSVGAITREAIDQWIAQLSDGTAPYRFGDTDHARKINRKPGKMAPAYVRHVAGRTFGGTMRYVTRQGWIGRNPFEGVELPRIPEKDSEALPNLTYAEVETLATAVKAVTGKSDDRALAHLLMYGGTRIGEATALKVVNFQYDQRRVRVEKTWTVDRDGKRVLGEPKGWVRRWVPIPQFLADEIQDLVHGRDPDSYMFQSVRGEAINDRNWYNRVWIKARTAVDAAAKLSVHDLRHVAATLSIGAGADVKLVQQMLGHKDATETLNTYAALWGDKVDEVAKKIESRRTKALEDATRETVTDAA